MSDLTPKQMENSLQHVQQEFGPLLMQFVDVARIRVSATATEEYMRDAGFTSPPFPPRKSASGPLRILSGRLARSLTGAMSHTKGGASPENISEVTSTKEGIKFTYGTKTPYARVNEKGFSGTVNIPAHQRTITQAFGRKIPAKTITVAAHTRMMVIPARPYLNPAKNDNVEWLQNWLADETQELILEATDG